MILHLAGLDKFIPPFINLINEEFDAQKHKFWLTGRPEKYPFEKRENTYLCKQGILNRITGFMRLVWQLNRSEKIILHGLFDIRVIITLSLCPWILSKCYWVIWGGDLYQYRKSKGDLRSQFKEFFRRYVIKRIGHLVTYIEGDADLAREWYGATGEYHECIMYLSNVVDPQLMTEQETISDKSGLNILLGNSADPSNNHIEALERLLKFKDRDIRIYVPLSYGDQNYAQKVISQGKAWFGDKFIPLTDFMPFEQYRNFLKSIDIAIFNHQRQQAMGNTITLLAMGKTVFMRNDVSQWEFLKGLEIKLYDIEKLELVRISPDEAEENNQTICSYFSKSTLIRQYFNIFEGKNGLSDQRSA